MTVTAAAGEPPNKGNGGSKTPPSETPRVAWTTSLFAALLLAGMVVGMIALGTAARRDSVLDAQDWQPSWLSDPLGWLVGVLTQQFWMAAAFVMMGVLVPLVSAFWPHVVRVGWRWPAWLGVGVVLAAMIRWAIAGVPPGIAELIVPLAGFAFGTWMADRWVRHDWSWRRPLATLVVGLILAVGLGAILLPMAVSRRPLEIPDAQLGQEARSRLAELIDDSRPQAVDNRTLRFSEDELNTLVGVALARGGDENEARVHLDGDAMHAEASLRLPRRLFDAAYLNVAASGVVRIQNERLFVRLGKLQVGELNVPAVLLRFLSPAVVSLSMEDRDARCLVCSIDSLACDNQAVTLVLKPGELSRDVVPSLVSILGGEPNVGESTELYVRQLVETAEEAPPGDARLAHVVDVAFALAAERSATLSAKQENRAAIFALAIVFGHRDVESLVGRVTDDALRKRMRPLMGTVALRDRRDWARHWLVSAAIEATGIGDASERLGTIKEQIDAGEGGSGFSFADLAADRAGIRLAVVATRDLAQAEELQQRLARGFVVDDFCPPISDLPEGLTAAEFDERYGGADDERYRMMIAEIDARLRQCDGLK